MITESKRTLYLEMSNGDRYVIHPSGAIERTDMLLNPSGQWIMAGLKTGREFVPLNDITPEWVQGHNLSRYRVVDIDHGTPRVWAMTHISRIWFYNTPQETNYYQYSRGRAV